MMRNADKLNPDNNMLAQDRTILANERTYQAWIRTGLSAFATGLGVANFLKDSMPLWMLLTIATILILLSIIAFLQATWRYNHLHMRMKGLDIDATSGWMVRAMSFSLVACSVLALVGMFADALS